MPAIPTRLLELAPPDRLQLEAWLAEFEEAWDEHLLAARVERLPPPGQPLRLPALIELVKIDLERNWQRGRHLTLGDYLARYPELGPAEALPPDLLLAEEEVCQQFGEGTATFRAPAAGAEANPPTLRQPSPPGASRVPCVRGYEVLGKIGQGGMGAVYKAHHLRLNRVVALKVVGDAPNARPEDLVRFRQEAEMIARLQHPNIVQIYEVGEYAGGSYLALEYVDGPALDRRISGTPQPPRQAAQLVEALARAVHYAHGQGIIHRDLKPANVLLTPAGAPKITDFGLARHLALESGLTTTGSVMGTPNYMAPEQAEGRLKDIGPHTDTYALGAILYECLTGRPPFQEATVVDTLEQVRKQDPVPPHRLLGSKKRACPADLETISLKCLEKEPAKRYASAEDLAEDLRRFLAGEPIRARPVGRIERLGRWCRRNPAVAALAATVVLLLGVLAGGALIKNAQLAAALRDSEAKRWESLRDQARAMRMSRHPGQRVKSLQAIREALELPLPPRHSLDELRTEAIAAFALPDLGVLREWEGWPTGTVYVNFDGNLERYARVATDGTVSVRRVSDDVEVAGWQEPVQGPWLPDESVLCFSPDGRFLCFRHLASGRLTVRRLDGPEPAVCHRGTQVAGNLLDFSPDNKTLAYPLTDTRIAVVDLASGQARSLDPTGVEQWDIRFAPDSRRFAVGARRAGQPVIEVRDAATGQVRQSLPHPKPGGAPAWHPDGRTLATCCDHDLRIRLWDVASGRLLRVLEGHKTRGIHCAFTRTGGRLLSNDWSGVLRVWEPSSGRQLLSFPAAGYSLLRISPDDRVSALDGTDFTKGQVLRLHAGEEYQTIEIRSGASNRGVVVIANVFPIHPGGRLLAARATDGSVVVDLGAGREVAALQVPSERPLLWEPSGALLTVGTLGLLRWPVRADPAELGRYRLGPPERLLPGSEEAGWGSSADAQTIAIPHFDRGAEVVHRGPPRGTVRLAPQQDVRSCAVSPDGRWVATGSHHTTDRSGAKVWEAATGKLVKELPVPGLCAVAFSPDGRWLVTTGGGCRLWEVGSWNEWWKVGGTYGCFSPDGQLLAVDDTPGAIRLVRPEDRAEVTRLEAPEQTRLLPGCFTPDGTRLIAVGGETQALHVWDLRAIRARLAELNLDWDLPPYPPAAQKKVSPPLTVSVDHGNLLAVTHPQQAVAVYSLAIALCPLNPEAYLQRGRAYGRLAQAQKAIADYSLFLALAPPEDKRRAEVLFRRSNNYRALNQRAGWLADLLQAVQLDLDEVREFHAEVASQCNGLAWQLVTGPEKERDPAKALPLAEKAVALMPKEPMYRNTLGVVYYRLGRYGPAVEALERSLRESKGEHAAYDLFFLALCHARLGEPSKAKEYYERAVRWVHERQDKLPADRKKELADFRAEAETP
jgi:WD40 repeat protein/tetratricopeptide (TPR) repeat protein